MFGRRNPDQSPANLPPAPREDDLTLDLLPDLPDIAPPTREPAPRPAPAEPPSDPSWYAGAPASYAPTPPAPAATQPLPAPPATQPLPTLPATQPLPTTDEPAPQPAAWSPQPATVPVAPREPAAAPRPKTATESVIGPDDFFDGSYRSERGVRIQGAARGSIESRQYIFVEAGAQVEADLSAEDITIAGVFSGKIACRRRLELAETGRVQGHIQTARLVVHEGGILDGELHMHADDAAPEAAQDDDRPQVAQV